MARSSFLMVIDDNLHRPTKFWSWHGTKPNYTFSCSSRWAESGSGIKNLLSSFWWAQDLLEGDHTWSKPLPIQMVITFEPGQLAIKSLFCFKAEGLGHLLSLSRLAIFDLARSWSGDHCSSRSTFWWSFSISRSIWVSNCSSISPLSSCKKWEQSALPFSRNFKNSFFSHVI